MNVYAIVGSHRRNSLLSQKLFELPNINLVGQLIFEREDLMPAPPEGLRVDLDRLWRRHFTARQAAEEKYFGDQVDLMKQVPTRMVSNINELNSEDSVHHLKSCTPDVVVITAVPIIREPLFSVCPEYRINLHLGLIPEYKGTITMFWPFYFMEPTMAGCTYHVIDSLVDTGFILHQSVPQLSKGDGMFDVACKATLTALEDLGAVLAGVEDRIDNDLKPKMDLTLRHRGKMFKNSDWRPELLRVNYEIFDDRMVDHVLDGRLKCQTPNLITI